MSEYYEEPWVISSETPLHISFAGRFSKPPIVVVHMSAEGSGRGIPYVSSVTAEGCEVGIWTPKPDTRPFDVKVIASHEGTRKL